MKFNLQFTVRIKFFMVISTPPCKTGEVTTAVGEKATYSTYTSNMFKLTVA